MKLPFGDHLDVHDDSHFLLSAPKYGCFAPFCLIVLMVAAAALAGVASLKPAAAKDTAGAPFFTNAAAQKTQGMKGLRNSARKDLQIYFVDVEGGQSTLFVTPAGESLLVDTGWADNNGRDAARIVAAAKKAGIHKIDYVVITHYHADHVGGVPQLVARIPVGTFVDHGPNRQTNDAVTEQGYEAYQHVLATGKYKHILAKPGEVIPIQGMHAEVVSADGATIANSLPGGGQANASACQASPKYPADDTENRRSVGMVITFDKLRILDLGDLTHDEEVKLMCPVNKLGNINIYVVSHHGWDQSSSPALVWGIAPRVAIMDNGAKKGGSPSVWDIIEKSPGLQRLWQLHYSDEGAAKHNVAPEYIANLDGPDAGNYLELTADPSGSFSVFNSRTGASKEYASQSMSAGSFSPRTMTPGVVILTPTQGVDFSHYLAEVLRTVKKNWYASMPDGARSGEEGTVAVQFQIRPNGQVEEAFVQRGSSLNDLDDSALAAVKSSNALPPLPAEFHGPELSLRMSFFYNVPIDTSSPSRAE